MGRFDKTVVVRYDSHHVRLHKGESQRTDGRYVFRWMGYDKKRHSIYANTLVELRNKAEFIKRDLSDGLRSDMFNATVDDVYELWKKTKRGIRDSTFAGYIYTYEAYIQPALGGKRIQQVVRSDIKAFYNNLIEQKQIKIATVDHVHNVLYQVFQLAVDDNIIRTNPVSRALKELKRSYGDDREKRKALSYDEEILLFRKLKKHPRYFHWYPLLFIMANTGMRIGEITGLRWCDIDMEKGIITIDHTLTYYNHRDENGCYFSMHKEPKTKAGIRKIPMIKDVKEAFKMQKEVLEMCDTKSVDHIDGYCDFIFVNRFGKVFNQNAVNAAIHRITHVINEDIIEKNGGNLDVTLIPYFTSHVLRHTFATRLCERGVNIKVIQYFMGHSEIDTTMDIYVHVTDELKADEMKKFEEYMTCMDNAEWSDILGTEEQ